MRVYTDEQLENCSKLELKQKLNMVNTSNDLSRGEIDANVAIIEFHLNGGVHHPMKDVVEDIRAGQADTNDLGGH